MDSDFDLDLGGDFGKMLLGNDKRASVATLRNDQYAGQIPAPRSLTTRPVQPAPIQIDKTTRVEPPQHSWSSHHSNEQLIASASPAGSPTIGGNGPPPVPRHTSPLLERQRPGTSPEVGARRPLLAPLRGTSEQEDGEDEEARLLKDSLSTVTKFMNGAGTSNQQSGSSYRRNDKSLDDDSDNLFDSSHAYSKYGSRYSARKQSSPPSSNKVMTPAEFERYRKDKERQEKERGTMTTFGNKPADDDDDEDNYEDDEDDAEKARQQAKQRRKQEAHMSVYRQQMMKVTGEAAGSLPPSRPSLQMSFSTPNLPNAAPAAGSGAAGNSDEDEEVPLAILAAHGFPNKARPPNRLSTVGSNPNLRATQQPSYQRPISGVGDAVAAGNPRLPAFARNLPKDPFLGAGLVRNPVRESFALGGGAAAGPAQPGAPVPPGGLIGVIAHEERTRAMRRGSPHLDGPGPMPGAAGFDPVAGIPANMMYQPSPMLTPGDQAQIQMTQQMQQFMQMQMQFMHMVAGQNGTPPVMPGANLTSPSVGNLSTMGGLSPGFRGPEMRHSFVGGNDSMLDLPYSRGDAQMRTMSMVQPSSASWIQPAQPAGYAPSIRIQGGGYAPSIAPSERSNIGLPGRYRPVSHVPPPAPTGHLRKSTTMSGAISGPSISVTKSGDASDEDDEEGWEAMKAKREKKKSLWRSKKSVGDDIGAFIS